MKEALTKPDCIALSEEKAMQYFGKFDCIGENFLWYMEIKLK